MFLTPLNLSRSRLGKKSGVGAAWKKNPGAGAGKKLPGSSALGI